MLRVAEVKLLLYVNFEPNLDAEINSNVNTYLRIRIYFMIS